MENPGPGNYLEFVIGTVKEKDSNIFRKEILKALEWQIFITN